MASVGKKIAKALDPVVEKTDIMLKALEDQDGLSDWERDFLESVSDWFYMKDKKLTSGAGGQFVTLERIYRKFF